MEENLSACEQRLTVTLYGCLLGEIRPLQKHWSKHNQHRAQTPALRQRYFIKKVLPSLELSRFSRKVRMCSGTRRRSCFSRYTEEEISLERSRTTFINRRTYDLPSIQTTNYSNCEKDSACPPAVRLQSWICVWRSNQEQMDRNYFLSDSREL